MPITVLIGNDLCCPPSPCCVRQCALLLHMRVSSTAAFLGQVLGPGFQPWHCSIQLLLQLCTIRCCCHCLQGAPAAAFGRCRVQHRCLGASRRGLHVRMQAAATETKASRLDFVEQAPPDPILGVSEAFKRDPSENKLNLGVGAYRDENLKPYVLNVVKKVRAAG